MKLIWTSLFLFSIISIFAKADTFDFEATNWQRSYDEIKFSHLRPLSPQATRKIVAAIIFSNNQSDIYGQCVLSWFTRNPMVRAFLSEKKGDEYILGLSDLDWMKIQFNTEGNEIAFADYGRYERIVVNTGTISNPIYKEIYIKKTSNYCK